jgi:hypothetical protein
LCGTQQKQPIQCSGASLKTALCLFAEGKPGVFPMSTVADRIVQTLIAANVSPVYGLVGDSLNGITDSLRANGEIQWAPTADAGGAAFGVTSAVNLKTNQIVEWMSAVVAGGPRSR